MNARHALSSLTAVLVLAAAPDARGALERVGPVNPDPRVGSYPAWYQDATGLALEFCDPLNQAEVDGGWCLLLPGDVAIPEAFPGNFFDEHFYFAADASMTPATGGKALLVLAMEAAFAGGPAAPGDQITFARIRMRLTDIPVSGTYRFIHPYGEEIFLDVPAGSPRGIFFTDDVGVNCPPGGPFDCALESRLGPFLLPSSVPGGAELPATPGPAGLYVADPARVGPVTGSVLPDFVDSTGALRNHNLFRIEGPPGSNLGGPGVDFIETTDFTLMGRIFTGTMPGRVDVRSANYTRAGSGQKLDVFASGFETVQGRLPAQPRPAAVRPVLSFFDAPCGGTVGPSGDLLPPFTAPSGAAETPMVSAGRSFWGQARPPAIPTAVCVKDAAARDVNGNVVPAYFPERVADVVTIAQALFDPAAGTLTVSASSSDETVPQVLTLGGLGDLVNGQIVVPLAAPPATVRVVSSAFGSSEHPVKTGFAEAPPPGRPVASNDAATFAEDSGPHVLDVLANDANVAGGTVTLTAGPRLGSAVVNADNTITYTPGVNANGTDGFSYQVTVGGAVSNTAAVTVVITPVNDPPTAVNDLAATSANVPVAIDVLANDTDPDGAADLAAPTNVTQPTPAGATVAVTGRTVTFDAAVAGTYTFTYQAQDAAGAASANTATVTVTVAAVEAISIARAEYRTGGGRLRVDGTIDPSAGQTLFVHFVNAAGAEIGAAGTAVAGAGGAWAIDLRGVVLPPGATRVSVTSSNGTVQTAPLVVRQ
jgi:hypothetical protein